MCSSAIAEGFLALVVGRARATAIYGDLVELAVHRGSLWFCIAYVRTIVSLTWRTPVALAAVIVSLRYLRAKTFQLLMTLSHPSVRDNLQFVHSRVGHPVYLIYIWLGRLEWIVPSWALWFVLPYIVVRFGARNRLSYLAGVLFLAALPGYFFRPIPGVLSLIAGTALMTAAFISPHWRLPMLFIGINSAIASAIYFITIEFPDPLNLFHSSHGSGPLGFFRMRIDELIIIATISLIGPLLHRWLLTPSEDSLQTNDGAAHA